MITGLKTLRVAIFAFFSMQVISSAQVPTFEQVKERADNALSTPKTGEGAPLRWVQDSIVVSTYPEP
jgi:hypothetical protein